MSEYIIRTKSKALYPYVHSINRDGQIANSSSLKKAMRFPSRGHACAALMGIQLGPFYRAASIDEEMADEMVKEIGGRDE